MVIVGIAIEARHESCRRSCRCPVVTRSYNRRHSIVYMATQAVTSRIVLAVCLSMELSAHSVSGRAISAPRRKVNARGMCQWVARIFSGFGAEGSEFPFRDGVRDVCGVESTQTVSVE